MSLVLCKVCGLAFDVLMFVRQPCIAGLRSPSAVSKACLAPVVYVALASLVLGLLREEAQHR